MALINRAFLVILGGKSTPPRDFGFSIADFGLNLKSKI
jgi:hypothetical protein